jgi:hypothetical protein
MRLVGCIEVSTSVKETTPTRTLFAHGISSSHSRAAPGRAIVFFFIINAIAFALFGASSSSLAQQDIPRSTRLTSLAAAKFPDLTHAERAMLWFSDIENVGRGDIAFAGPSTNPDDPSNDPKNAEKWDHQREIRATLIRWMLVDHQAAALMDPTGVQVAGARISGGLKLARVRTPFSLALTHCSIPERIVLEFAELPGLDLSASYTGEIDGRGMHVSGNVVLASGYHASSEVELDTARIDGDLDCGEGNFRHAEHPDPTDPLKTALSAYIINVKGNVYLIHSSFDGAVMLGGSTIGSDLHCDSGRFINPGNVAIFAEGASIGGVVYLNKWNNLNDFEANGMVDFLVDSIGNSVDVENAKFLGARGEPHGFLGGGMSVKRAFTWRNVTLQNGATLDLGGASVEWLLDEEKSWPAPGDLRIDGFQYSGFGLEGPLDVKSRLRWLRLQPPGLHVRTYRELAKFYADGGDDVSALQVLVAKEDARYLQYGWLGRVAGSFLKATIGYGHRPLLTVLWSMVVVLFGWLIVTLGMRAGVMRQTWPEASPEARAGPYEKLHPFLYSLDVFLPFVNLNQRSYWWPDAEASGDFAVLHRTVRLRGSALRYYLWLQILAGWLLSAIFVAGVTGLIRND